MQRASPFFLLVVTLSLTPTAWAGSLAELDAKNGFRDLKFEQAPPKGMKLLEDDGDTKYYIRPADNLRIGAATAHRIICGFDKGRFFTVLIQTKGLSNSRALLDVFRQAYGATGTSPHSPGFQTNQFLETYLWSGERVTARYDESPITKDANAFISSAQIDQERDAEQKTKAKKGAGDL